ncbi:hypothetical protein E3N88_39144 [Mikania micrantha]|uniref:Uncharacterized protein n=1 Tax=Mikania micrantha TaxID=192012 RepID=A0A5N6LW58_9ASTR|nr:hypothetical protein E3N88_39144 [Mikania micrantha]
MSLNCSLPGQNVDRQETTSSNQDKAFTTCYSSATIIPETCNYGYSNDHQAPTESEQFKQTTETNPPEQQQPPHGIKNHHLHELLSKEYQVSNNVENQIDKDNSKLAIPPPDAYRDKGGSHRVLRKGASCLTCSERIRRDGGVRFSICSKSCDKNFRGLTAVDFYGSKQGRRLIQSFYNCRGKPRQAATMAGLEDDSGDEEALYS